MKLYSKRGLAKEVGVSTTTLDRWIAKGWLRPAAVVGEDRRYNLEGFEQACTRSLEGAHEFPPPPSFSEIGARHL